VSRVGNDFTVWFGTMIVSVAAPVVLPAGDDPRLIASARSPAVEAGLARRARIVLLAAEGLPNAAIARVGMSRPITWRRSASRTPAALALRPGGR
jgi:hypothetical protein